MSLATCNQCQRLTPSTSICCVHCGALAPNCSECNGTGRCTDANAVEPRFLCGGKSVCPGCDGRKFHWPTEKAPAH